MASSLSGMDTPPTRFMPSLWDPVGSWPVHTLHLATLLLVVRELVGPPPIDVHPGTLLSSPLARWSWQHLLYLQFEDSRGKRTSDKGATRTYWLPLLLQISQWFTNPNQFWWHELVSDQLLGYPMLQCISTITYFANCIKLCHWLGVATVVCTHTSVIFLLPVIFSIVLVNCRMLVLNAVQPGLLVSAVQCLSP
jgi:hypothetical protein